MLSNGEAGYPLTPSERSRLQEGQFEMRSLTLILTNDHGGQRFEGPGSVSMDSKGDLSFTLFDSGADSRVGLEWWSRPRGWIPTEEYYDLEVCELSGRRWRASRIIPKMEEGSGHAPGMIIRGALSELRHAGAREASGSPSVRAHFPGFVRLPLFQPTKTATERGDKRVDGWTRDHQKYGSVGFEAQIERDGDGFSVWVRPPGSLKADAPQLRVEESIWLLLGTPLHASVVESWTADGYEVRLRRRKPPRFHPRLEPPIPVYDPQFIASHQELLCRYLSFVWEEPGARFHPLSSKIFDVLRASSLSVVAEARAVAIAVEAIAKRFFAGFAEISDEERDGIRKLKHHIRSWPGDETLRRRAEGAVRSFARPRAREALEALVELRLVSREEVEAWVSLRNPSAHGDDPSGPITEFADQSERVWGLLTKLVFQVIGFKGDWVAPGRPDRTAIQFSPIGGRTTKSEGQ